MKTLLLLSLMAAAGVGAAPTPGTSAPADAATSRPARQAPSSPAAKSTQPSQQAACIANIRKGIEVFNRVADELEGVRDKASADAAADQVRRCTARLEMIGAASRTMSQGLSEQERGAIFAAVGEEMEKSAARMERAAKDLAAKGCYGSEKLAAALKDLIGGGEGPAAGDGASVSDVPEDLRPLATLFIEDVAQRRAMAQLLGSVSDRAAADAVAPAIVEQADQLRSRMQELFSLLTEESNSQGDAMPLSLEDVSQGERARCSSRSGACRSRAATVPRRCARPWSTWINASCRRRSSPEAALSVQQEKFARAIAGMRAQVAVGRMRCGSHGGCVQVFEIGPSLLIPTTEGRCFWA